MQPQANNAPAGAPPSVPQNTGSVPPPTAAAVSASAARAAAPNAQQIAAQQSAGGVPMGHPTGANVTTTNVPIKAPRANTAQKSLLISEIRDGLVIMKDGTFRAVIAAQSINFDLMSPNEQDSVEYAYQSFLNSLSFDIQISIRSQKIDIGPYLEKLAKIRREQDNMLLNVLMDDYMIFIDALAKEANIMDKSFFICFSYGAEDRMKQLGVDAKKGLAALTNPNPQAVKIGRPEFESAKTEMARRSASIIDGLRAVGVPAVRLDTRALAMLYYNFNNPDTAVNQPLVDWQRYTHLYTTKGQRGPEGEEA
ncbi:hypothetical protein FWC63_00350 [Candidatus Saccharibacteria bacterium]|nr:hypothetical protein [Candidatus Saccharibacteria bacterium]